MIFSRGVCARTHTHTSYKLASFSVFTSVSLQKTGALETVSETVSAVAKKVPRRCRRSTVNLVSIPREFQTGSDRK